MICTVLTTLIGCGPNRKELTPSLAKTLVQEFVNGRFFGLSLAGGANRLEELEVKGALRTKAQGSQVLINWKEVHAYMSREWLYPIEDDRPRLADIVKALNRRGYVTLERRKVTVPDLSGQYSGFEKLSVFPNKIKVYIEQNGANVTGWFDQQCYGEVRRRNLVGSIDPTTSKVHLRAAKVISGFCADPFNGRLFDVSIVGSTIKLQFIEDNLRYFTLEASWSGKMVTLEPYTFKPTDKLRALDLDGTFAKGGTLAITGCSDLVLVPMATNAAAGRCTFRVDLNDLGKALVGSEAVYGHAEVQFLKRPDGSWFAHQCAFEVQK